MRQCDGGNRSNAAVLCGALDAELQHLAARGPPGTPEVTTSHILSQLMTQEHFISFRLIPLYSFIFFSNFNYIPESARSLGIGYPTVYK